MSKRNVILKTVSGSLLVLALLAGCESESKLLHSLGQTMRPGGGGIRLHFIDGELLAISPEDVQIPATDPCMVGVEVGYQQGCLSGGCIIGTYGCGTDELSVPEFIDFDD